MKKIEIVEVENGYVVTITHEGNQSLYDYDHTVVAKDNDELLEFIEKELKDE